MGDETFFLVAACLAEGNGLRGTARILKAKGLNLKPDTVQRVAARLGKHAQEVVGHYLADLHPGEIQLDELWSFLKKKEKNLLELEALQGELGDCWIWVAYDPETKLILGLVLGKRTKGNAVELLRRVKQVVGEDCFPMFTSDELACYEDAIVEVFGVTVQPERQSSVGRLPKPRRVPHPQVKYGVVHKEREKNRVVRVRQRVVHGSPEDVQTVLDQSGFSNRINTSGVERENGKFRAGSGRLRRKTLGFSKKKGMLGHGVEWWRAYDHFCFPNKGLRQASGELGRKWTQRTPMMAAGKTDHVWAVKELVLCWVPLRASSDGEQR